MENVGVVRFHTDRDVEAHFAIARAHSLCSVLAPAPEDFWERLSKGLEHGTKRMPELGRQAGWAAAVHARSLCWEQIDPINTRPKAVLLIGRNAQAGTAERQSRKPAFSAEY